MCGICGVLYLNERRSVDAGSLKAMADTIVHRGPDDSGIYTNGPCGFGHRRLSIIDIQSGQQPMTISVAGTSATIVYNGEIYNYLELRKELQNSGHRFKTRSDTEVILAAYLCWGKRCVERFIGMFSFAIWDQGKNCLFLARDRMGIKPLYYYLSTDVFLFASEIKAILASKLLRSKLDHSVLDSFMTLGFVPGPRTMFKHILKLLPGHTMSIEATGKTETKCYWNFNKIPPAGITFFEAQEKLEELLKESVKIRLMSDVPIGVLLSGGLDSSAITILMSQMRNIPVQTFAVGYANAQGPNDLEFAKAVARLYQTEHHEFILKPYDFLDFVPDMLKIIEEPLVETSTIPLFHISKMAKPFATVLLSGEGSDELFAGYDLYSKIVLMGRNRLWQKPIRMIPNAWLPGDKLKKYADWVATPFAYRYRGPSGVLTDRIRRVFYSEDLLALTKEDNYLEQVYSGWFEDVKGQSLLSQMLYVDAKTWLVDDLLLKADKMSMAASIELRVPFLDHRIVEFAASLPSRFKQRRSNGKVVLKEMMNKYLPKEIIHRTKTGFSVPEKWFSDELYRSIRDLLLSKKFLEKGYFKEKYIVTMLERHQKGREDYWRRLFALTILYHWLDIYDSPSLG